MSILKPPKLSSNIAPLQNKAVPITLGVLVLYENDGLPFTGVVLSEKKQKYQILNYRGREVELPSNRLYVLPGNLPQGLTSTAQKTEYLSNLHRTAQTNASSLDMEEIWGFVVDEARDYTPIELSKIYFGNETLDNYLSLFLALIEDRIFFKRNKDFFLPRPKDIKEELERAEAARKLKLEEQNRTLDYFAEKLADKSPTPTPEVLKNIQILAAVAAGTPNLDNSKQKDAKNLLDLLEERLGIELPSTKEKKAFDILLRTGHFNQNTNLSIIRHEIPVDFSNEVLEEAKKFSCPKSINDFADKNHRKDLTHLSSFTIDDESTKDMDDALSFELTSNGIRLYVHISDVSYFIPIGSHNDRCAASRLTSIYCPDQTINMLPEILAQNLCSLVEGEVRPTVSCVFDLGPGFEIRESFIIPSLIKVTKRLNYDEVEGILEDPKHKLHQEMSIFFDVSNAHETRRLKNGAIRILKREVNVIVSQDGSFKLVEVDEHSPSRNTVGEMMVMANALMAKYAYDNGVVMFFRGQEAPDEDSNETRQSETPMNSQTPVGNYQQRAKLKKSTVSLVGEPHASLGLEVYAQVTSPIRRYFDLCNQRQILAHLKGDPPIYKTKELEKILLGADEILGTAIAVGRESKRYWLYKYLQELKRKGETIRGTVLKTDHKHPLVELDQIFIPVVVKVGGSVKPGDQLLFRISSVDPRYGDLKLEVVN